MNVSAHNIATAIKEYLINLAVEDKLPTDLNELSVSELEDIIKKHYEGLDIEAISARHYLCGSDIEVYGMIELIKEQSVINGTVLIDEVDGVIVWEKVENSFTCDEFLEMISS